MKRNMLLNQNATLSCRLNITGYEVKLMLMFLAPTDDSRSEEGPEKAVYPTLSEVKTMYYFDFTMTLEAIVAAWRGKSDVVREQNGV
jgi:hypothetical protein